MSARIERFDLRPGGSYRMVLSYADASASQGKASADSDIVEARFVDIADHGSVRSVYFTDPNGIALEASWWVRDVTGRADDYDDDQRVGDPDPIPALHEVRTTGTPTAVPSTRLG